MSLSIIRVDFGRDLEQALNLYVDCRAAFANLDLVLYQVSLMYDMVVASEGACAPFIFPLFTDTHTRTFIHSSLCW